MKRIFTKLIHAIQIIRTFKNWPVVFLSFFGPFNAGLFSIGSHTVCILRNGVKYKVRTTVPHMDDAAAVIGTWGVETYHGICRRNITDAHIVIDLGAHIGGFSVMAATLARNAKVYAYEPEPDNFGLLRDNVELNHLEHRIVPLNYAVVGLPGDRKRKLHLHGSPEQHSLYSPTGDDYVTVECLTLPEVFQSHEIETCDFLKMDCEGAEYDIMLNCPGEYLSRIRKIHVEYQDGPGIDHGRQELVDVLKHAGFEVTLKAWDTHFGYVYGERTSTEPMAPPGEKGQR